MQFYHGQAFTDSILSQLHHVYGKMLYLPTCILTIDGTSVVKIVPKFKGVKGVFAPPGSLGWKDHTYQSNEISASRDSSPL